MYHGGNIEQLDDDELVNCGEQNIKASGLGFEAVENDGDLLDASM